MDDPLTLLSEPSPPFLNPNSDELFPPQSPLSFAQKHFCSLDDSKRKIDESISNLNYPLGDNCEYNLLFDDLDNFQFPWEEHFGNSAADVDLVSCLPHNVRSEKVLKLSCMATDSGNLVFVDNKMDSESTSSKCDKTSVGNENSNGNVKEEDRKREVRLMRNRKSAQLSRRRKKQYVDELEETVRNVEELEKRVRNMEYLEGKVRSMQFAITDLNGKLLLATAEIANLRQQLNGGNAIQPPPPAHMVAAPHMAAMPYSWMPCVLPHTVKPQGSQIGIVAKAKKNGSSKGKKVASVTFLGLFFFVFFFGGGTRNDVSAGYFKNKFDNQHRGMVVTVNHGHLNRNHDVWSGFSSGKFDNTRNKKKGPQRSLSGLNEFLPPSNASESESLLVGTLFEPRNDTLDGIIHSALANEKGMASQEQASNIRKKEKGSQPSSSGLNEFLPPSNARVESLFVAPLYEPRNDTLDGITHSALANEKGMASQEQASKVNNKRDTGSGISKDFPPA